MTEKLKTLKEITVEKRDLIFRLRQEAIKWIKAIEKKIESFEMNTSFELDGIHLEVNEEYQICDEINAWIKHFFNIKEKDLK